MLCDLQYPYRTVKRADSSATSKNPCRQWEIPGFPLFPPDCSVRGCDFLPEEQVGGSASPETTDLRNPPETRVIGIFVSAMPCNQSPAAIPQPSVLLHCPGQ